ncbi:MAG: monovalent cation/H+ antiporter subunit D [Gallionella sp.]|nr:monovalent cation/H+ antiporter subunit D [Gallionella sp.]
MNAHAAIFPILIPLAAALLQLVVRHLGLPVQRHIGLFAAVLGILSAVWLVQLADSGNMLVYALGDWAAPVGIVLVADRLAAGMTLLTALLAGASLLYASGGFDKRGRHFHPLFQLQIMGIQGAFLTGDLFNLFVFFEVMLLASYTLLAHGGGLARSRASLTYVVLNLAGSALFLIALGLLYGTLGTLNLADVALRLQTAEHNIALARLAGALLIAVFALKAALLPLSFWLPHTYAAAGAPVAALFVIMTKVGIVAILRVQAIAFAPSPTMADLLTGWLTPLALMTVLFAALGALVATRLRYFAAWLVLVSAGTLLIAPAHAQADITAAALYYLVQSTFIGAAFFLLTELISEQRGEVADAIQPGPSFQAPWLALGFFTAAITAAGLPPFSGFIGKLMLLASLWETAAGTAIWIVLLIASFLIIVALSRVGSRLFWQHKAAIAPLVPHSPPWQSVLAVLLLIAAGPLLAIFARPVADYAARAATQLHAPGAYVNGVLGTSGLVIVREARP